MHICIYVCIYALFYQGRISVVTVRMKLKVEFWFLRAFVNYRLPVPVSIKALNGGYKTYKGLYKRIRSAMHKETAFTNKMGCLGPTANHLEAGTAAVTKEYNHDDHQNLGCIALLEEEWKSTTVLWKGCPLFSISSST